MSNWEWLFWGSAAVVLYTYVGYPLVLMLLGQCSPRVRQRERFTGAVSIVLAARNEEARIGRRVQELYHLLQRAGLQGEIIVVSDGSSDRTASIARASTGSVRVLELAQHVGKAAALNEGAAAARYDVLVFADVRQTWSPDALPLLLENFADPRVGAVSGGLIVESAPGVMAGVGLYWRYEKWLRRLESQVHSSVGVTGAICAVRRLLFRDIPPGTVLDDVYWPLRVVMQGYQVVHDPRARAYDRLPERAGDELRRKARTLSGNLQLVTRLPEALLPWKNAVWFQWLSHKLLRLVVPWLLLAMLAGSALLPGAVYQSAFWTQAGGYLVGVAGLHPALGRRFRLMGAAASFLVLNAAAWLAFWVWLCGRAAQSWSPVVYPAGESPAAADASQTTGPAAAAVSLK
jgi:cellulose synthase/poly-beta-1,6-N-acetylglucosamine synthase-like glycosyltransferase